MLILPRSLKSPMDVIRDISIFLLQDVFLRELNNYFGVANFARGPVKPNRVTMKISFAPSQGRSCDWSTTMSIKRIKR